MASFLERTRDAGAWTPTVGALCALGAAALTGLLVAMLPPKFVESRSDVTRNQAKGLHAVAQSWRMNHGHCPTFEELRREKELAASAETNDAWGTPYVIVCAGEATFVFSAGADERFGTADDIRLGDESIEVVFDVRHEGPC